MGVDCRAVGLQTVVKISVDSCPAAKPTENPQPRKWLSSGQDTPAPPTVPVSEAWDFPILHQTDYCCFSLLSFSARDMEKLCLVPGALGQAARQLPWHFLPSMHVQEYKFLGAVGHFQKHDSDPQYIHFWHMGAASYFNVLRIALDGTRLEM